MTASTAGYSPLPQAPTAHVPTGITETGAARSAWHPNVAQWVAVWRLLVAAQGALGILLADGTASVPIVLPLAAAGALLPALISMRHSMGRTSWRILTVDLLLSCALLAAAQSQTSFALVALYTYSTVIWWASGKPAGSFVAAAACGTTYVIAGLTGPYADSQPASFVGNFALYFFFALATSGFFTLAHRIGALEIATEIARERARYRRDLHDRLGQALCGLHFELQAVHASGASDGMSNRLTSLADGYRDAGVMLEDFFRQGEEPLVATNVGSLVQQEARRMAAQSGARIDVTIDGDPGRIPPAIRPHIWSVAGECMTNALKNGEASGIDIDLSISDSVCVLSVTDDGIGFDNPPGTITEKDGHYGLREMAERARLCSGEVVIASQPGFGTRVRLQVPLPEDGGADIIERDVSTLRTNVWSLVSFLRTALGVLTLAQLIYMFAKEPTVLLGGITVLVCIDVISWVLFAGSIQAHMTRSSLLPMVMVVAYVLLMGLCLTQGVVPAFMLYAPLVLLAAGVSGGRTLAARLTIVFAGGSAAIVLLANILGQISVAAERAALIYIATVVVIGLSATQGAKLLDRLEALQIRVRFQALARLRQGLSSKLRDQLVQELDELEHTTRGLAHRDAVSEVEFTQATDRLQKGSSDLKARLREIVHTLADPTPGRT